MGKNSKFTNQLINNTRTKYGEQAQTIIDKALKINKQICDENMGQPPKVAMHTYRTIYPSISFYKAVTEVTGNEDEAYYFIADFFNAEATRFSIILKRLCKLPGLYHLVPWFMKVIIRKFYGTASGFEFIEYPKEKGMCHIDVKNCPYYRSCVKYDSAKLVTAFCNSDDIGYGNMHPKLIWGRKKTLGRGNDCCDFIISVEK